MSNLVIPDGGTIGSASDTDAISIASDGQVTFSSNTLATQSEVFGTKTEGTITASTTALTVASASGISNGDFVVGQGITPGTTVSSGAGTTSLVLSANANEDLSSDPVTFYSATKLLSPGLVGGMLCRAWVNFNGTGTIAIRAAANVSSITDLGGVGLYRVNFRTAMPDANYSCVATGGASGNRGNSVNVTNMVDNLVEFSDGLDSAYYDSTFFNVAIFR